MTPARRIRTLVSLEEAELEAERQNLLDQEWNRRKDKIKSASWIASGAIGTFVVGLLAEVAKVALGP